jgi:hypothetical protein
MLLSASFDAVARVAHITYLTGDYGNAGFRRGQWRENLRQVAPSLAALADDNTRGGAILQIIGALRNTIHGEGLRSDEIAQSGQPALQLVRLTEREGQRLKRLLESINADTASRGLHETRTDLRLVAVFHRRRSSRGPASQAGFRRRLGVRAQSAGRRTGSTCSSVPLARCGRRPDRSAPCPSLGPKGVFDQLNGFTS